jgi:hypothetical protein
VTFLKQQIGDDHVFLLGRPPLSELLGFVRTMAVDGQIADQGQLATEWRRANDHLKSLESTEAGAADGATVHPLDSSLSAEAAALLAAPLFRKSFSMVPARLGMVELDRLVVFQKFIDLAFVEELKRQLSRQPTPADLFHFCLPKQPALPQVIFNRTAQNAFTFVSPSKDFRFLDGAILEPAQLAGYESQGHVVAALALVIGYGSNYLNVASVENRLLLGNGSHRAYALRELGITHVPCIIQDVTRREELEVLGFGDLQQYPDRYLTSARPPMLKDYFDARLRKIVPVARKHRALRVTFGVEPIDVPSR